MVCCSYVGICFGVEHHHMPDRVLHLAWRTKDYKNWSQDHGLTWAVRGAHIRSGFEGKMGCTWAVAFGLYPPRILDFDSMHALSLRISGNFNFEHLCDIWPIWCELAVFWHVMSSNS